MKFIVSTPFDFLASAPAMVEAKDSLFALANMGFTVWTEEEWNARERNASPVDWHSQWRTHGVPPRVPKTAQSTAQETEDGL